jgi:Na+/proline symporter
VISSSIAQGMFFDLLTWLTFLGSVYAIKFKPNNYLKVTFILLFSLFAVIIQQLKGDYREATWKQGEEASVETVKKSLKKKNEKQGIFTSESLGASNLRINQGYIVTNIMKTVPDKVPYENGAELELILESSILPRIIAPNKLNSGDRFIFMKYSGIPVAVGTSMALSSVGDAYINFGPLGGTIFMFFFGLLFNYFLKLFNKKGKEFPIAILLATVAFYYPIRPDCELQTILGHLFKSTIIIFVILSVWRHNFKLSTFSLKRKRKELAF